jgi:hypothetical protein
VEPRNTGDIDFFIENSAENAEKMLKVLKEFGFADLDITIQDFIKENMVVQLGVPPVRIDIISGISGVSFNEAFETKVKNKFGKTTAFFISKSLLIKNKKASARIKDLADVELLQKSKL